MWTVIQWVKCLSGFCLMTTILVCIAIFLAYVKKKFYDYEELSERLLNVLFTKLAIFSFMSAILISVENVLHEAGMILSAELKMFLQVRAFISFIMVFTFLEISVCSLLRLYSSQLYIWASSIIPARYITFVQSLMIMFYLLGKKSKIDKTKNVTELLKIMRDIFLPFVSFVIITTISLRILFWLRLEH